ncbi:Sec-independent protein translocase subunit TatA [Actinotalea sp. AC32]|nr:Sec-independent protein translocase subunit TatA [Actinotalea sp. AC32]
MVRIQGWHIVVLLVVIVLLFGANRLPDLARSVGQSLKIFKNEVKDLRDDPADGATGARGSAVTPADAHRTDPRDGVDPSVHRSADGDRPGT